MTSSAASVDRNSAGYRIYDLEPRRFCVVNADPSTGIRLEPGIFGRNSQNEVTHKSARINPGSRVALRYNIIKWIPQGEIGAAPETVVEEIAFKSRSDYSRPKDVPQFDAAKKTNVIFWVHVETVSEERIIRIILCKSSVVTAVLINIRSPVDATIETSSVNRWRWRCDLFVFDSRPGLQRSGEKSCERNGGD